MEFEENNDITRGAFQNQLSKDVRRINKSKNLFIQADKTSNVYEVDKITYKKLLNDNITSNYKKVDESVINDINKEAKSLTDDLKISDRVEIPPVKNAYITIKDHKPDFPTNIKCRLINPTKSNIGKISKQILDRINYELKDKLNLQQLKNTDEAIAWFKRIDDKNNSLMISCDIVDFYPSISQELFEKTIVFAEKYVVITETEKNILMNARKSVLHSDDAVWTKKSGLFDVTMGSFDGAQISDLVGLYILHKVKNDIPSLNFALYRDDGIAYHKKMRPQFVDKIRKKLHKVFGELNLKITVETTLTKVNFLDVTFDILENTYEPFRKPNDKPLYIHRESNHPPHIMKNIPISVNKRLTNISSNEILFDKHKQDYQIALKQSGFRHILNYNHPCNNIKTNEHRNNGYYRSQTRVKSVNSYGNIESSQTIVKQIEDNEMNDYNIRLEENNMNKTGVNCTNSNIELDGSQTHVKNVVDECRRSQRIKEKNDKLNVNNIEKPKLQNSQKSTKDKKAKNENKKNKRKRNIIYWNPPYNKNLKTNIGKEFLKLIDKHFPTNNELSVAINRHSVKISYSTTKNMNDIMIAHNLKVLKESDGENVQKECNCRNTCPVPNECRESNVVYKAEVNGSIYVGMTSNEIRNRVRAHRHSFRTETKKRETALSSYIWDRKLNIDESMNVCEPEIKWSICRKCFVYKPGMNDCDLCLTEKLFILKNVLNGRCLNKRGDIGNKCIHRRSYFYSSVYKDKNDFVDII